MINPFIIKAAARVASFGNMWVCIMVSRDGFLKLFIAGTVQMSVDQCTAGVVSPLRTVNGIGAH
jgi:hypothetical protein